MKTLYQEQSLRDSVSPTPHDSHQGSPCEAGAMTHVGRPGWGPCPPEPAFARQQVNALMRSCKWPCASTHHLRAACIVMPTWPWAYIPPHFPTALLLHPLSLFWSQTRAQLRPRTGSQVASHRTHGVCLSAGLHPCSPAVGCLSPAVPSCAELRAGRTCQRAKTGLRAPLANRKRPLKA